VVGLICLRAVAVDVTMILARAAPQNQQKQASSSSMGCPHAGQVRAVSGVEAEEARFRDVGGSRQAEAGSRFWVDGLANVRMSPTTTQMLAIVSQRMIP